MKELSNEELQSITGGSDFLTFEPDPDFDPDRFDGRIVVSLYAVRPSKRLK